MSARPADSRTGLYVAVGVALFLVWSNSFVAAAYLLGAEREAARLDWVSLAVGRFAPVGPLCLAYCLIFRRRESLGLVRRFPYRLPIAALLAAPAYNFALYFGQQHGVPAAIASLTTALLPLFLIVLSALALGERLTARKGLAFLVALAGLVTIATTRGGGGAIADYGAVLAITALAPLSWATFSILSKPVTAFGSPLTWTYLAIGLGTLPLLALLPFRTGAELAALDARGWSAVLYLSVPCTVVGYAVWSWLLRHLPASSVGFFVFLNPPLTLLSKAALAALVPATFVWGVSTREVGGVVLALTGLAIALWPERGAAPEPARAG